MWIPPFILGFIVVFLIVRSRSGREMISVVESNEMIRKMDEVVTQRDAAIRRLLCLQASEALAWKRQLKMHNIAPFVLDHVIVSTRSLVQAFTDDTLPLFEHNSDDALTANDIVAEALPDVDQAAVKAAVKSCITSTLASLPYDPNEDDDLGIEALTKAAQAERVHGRDTASQIAEHDGRSPYGIFASYLTASPRTVPVAPPPAAKASVPPPASTGSTQAPPEATATVQYEQHELEAALREGAAGAYRRAQDFHFRQDFAYAKYAYGLVVAAHPESAERERAQQQIANLKQYKALRPAQPKASVADSDAATALDEAQALHFALNFDEARQAYQLIVDRFPESREAKMAATQLANLNNRNS